MCGALLLLTACGVNPLSRKYEYEEEVFLDLDGSATMYVNASVPALVALRGAKLPIDPGARLDRAVVRDLYASPATRVANVNAVGRLFSGKSAPDRKKIGITRKFMIS